MSITLFPLEIHIEPELDIGLRFIADAIVSVEAEPPGHSLPTNNLRLGIAAYGAGVVETAPILVGIKATVDAPILLGIAPVSIEPPQNILAYHLGQGAVLFTWDYPESGQPLAYEIFIGQTENSQFFPQQDGYVTGSDRQALIRNVPIGVSSYFKVRSVHHTGEVSEFEDVYRGQPEADRVADFQITAVSGSKIAAGAYFAGLLEDEDSDYMFAVQTAYEIEVTC